MVKFGKQLLYHQVDGWSESYINYKDLKKVAKIGVYDARDGSTVFTEATKKEVDKVEKFYIDRLRDFEEQYKIIRGWKASTDESRPRVMTTPGRLRVMSTGSSGDDEDETEGSNLSQRASLERAVVDLWRHIQFLRNFCTFSFILEDSFATLIYDNNRYVELHRFCKDHEKVQKITQK